jgi:hypothetical protein
MSKITSSKSKKARIFKELVNILGEENVSENLAVRAGYRGGVHTLYPPLGKSPEIVTIPKSVEHVQEVVKLANRENVSLLPITCSTITRNCEADILLDMMGMDKILKVDTENSYVLLEPGVTFNRLDPILQKENFVIPRGTFPVTLSVVSNLAAIRSQDHFLTSRNGNLTLGLEIVLFDGTVLRTGLATLGIDFWQYFRGAQPDLKGLFVNSVLGIPKFGIITKAAIKIIPMMEARALPLGGFDNFANAYKYCKVLGHEGIVDQATIWNWVLVETQEVRAKEKDGKEEIDFINHRMKAGYNEPYRGLCNYYTLTTLRGYKEQVDVNLKICERLAKEHGGRILPEEELQNTIPNNWRFLKKWYVDFDFLDEQDITSHTWNLGGEGRGDSNYYIGFHDDLIQVEKAYGKRLKEKYNELPPPFICRTYELGSGGHLRYIPTGDQFDEFQWNQRKKVREEMNAWVLENFPNVHPAAGSRQINTYPNTMITVLNKIREVLDPNHIGYIPGEKRLESEDEDKITPSITG